MISGKFSFIPSYFSLYKVVWHNIGPKVLVHHKERNAIEHEAMTQTK